MTDTTSTSNNWGGARPNSGRPALFKEKTTIVATVESTTKKRFHRLADLANDVVITENQKVDEEYQDQEIPVSELSRKALTDLMEDYLGDPEELLHEIRPYLGKPKPDLDSEVAGRLFDEPVRFTTYVEQDEKDDLALLAELLNARIKMSNKRVERKKDEDQLTNNSELARYAFDRFLDRFEGDEETLAYIVRPMLGAEVEK